MYLLIQPQTFHQLSTPPFSRLRYSTNFTFQRRVLEPCLDLFMFLVQQPSLWSPFTVILGNSLPFLSCASPSLCLMSSSFLVCFSFLWGTEGLNRPRDRSLFLSTTEGVCCLSRSCFNNGREGGGQRGRGRPGVGYYSDQKEGRRQQRDGALNK